MGNAGGTRLPSRSDVNGSGWERLTGSRAGIPLRRSQRACGSRCGRYGGGGRAAADLDGLVRIIKRKLKKIQYRPHLVDGCLAATGLIIEPW